MSVSVLLVVLGIFAVLAGIQRAITATIQRNVTIGGKSFADAVAITGGNLGVVVEQTVGAALPGTMTAAAQSAATVSAASWSGGVASFTTSGAHLLTNGQIVTISGVTPSGYNVTAVATVVDGTHFTVPIVSSLGSYSSGGSVAEPATITTSVTNTIVGSSRVDLFFIVGGVQKVRRGVTVGSVVGNAMSITGGAGAALPANTTVLQACVPVEVEFNVVAANMLTLAMFSAAIGCFDFVESDQSTEVAEYLLPTAGYSEIWDNQGPDANPFGSNVAFAYMSHNNTTAGQVMRTGAITT